MSTAPTPPKRKRGRPRIEGLAERRADEILPVAINLFARNGYSCTDLQVVADKLGVGKGTLYRYFPSKKDLFQAALTRVLTGMREAVDAAVAQETDPLDQLYAAIRAYLSYFDEHPEYVELIMQERAEFRDKKRSTYFEHREAAIGRWHDFYRGLIAAGRLRDRLPVERITDVLSSAVYGTMCTNYFAGHEKSLAQQAEDILEVALHGLLTPEESTRRMARIHRNGSKESAE
ncbi:MAG TPA: TetR/AcrR family transcriptional regulator [Phycisphaerales bacterium]|nr:TetR/AcrR family transcriptional regulator [Phycisphaerales bacterium]